VSGTANAIMLTAAGWLLIGMVFGLTKPLCGRSDNYQPPACLRRHRVHRWALVSFVSGEFSVMTLRLSTTRLAVSQALADDSGEISDCYLRVLQVRMPNLLPLETVEARVSHGP